MRIKLIRRNYLFILPQIKPNQELADNVAKFGRQD
jgi:hypothetical protein